MESIYFAFAVSIIRTGLTVIGAWLVSRGLVEDGLAKEVAAGLAVIVVSQVWGFWRAYSRTIYQKWLVAIGLDSPADTDPAQVEQAAKKATKEGMLP